MTYTANCLIPSYGSLDCMLGRFRLFCSLGSVVHVRSHMMYYKVMLKLYDRSTGNSKMRRFPQCATQGRDITSGTEGDHKSSGEQERCCWRYA